ncbi:sigma-70 family RNA polymerase sigma factor [Dyella solisilvae]|uniref:Sigma-70 family RNA polymerase sigma factor n=1 Tax=Dyella solisilvae TaxID=1920168 RepID=A0A370K414_9GAMM|nr:sigma-70 family RNA polymerase sigma factor [Dyella solisilvae]RDI97403.1 sigma-70 family RNA polymerase sigma factor [Dyella solisilvae]
MTHVGGKGEFDQLLREHAGLLSRIAASYEADRALRDDLLQDMALALWRALPSWRGDAPLRAFVARVAHNRGATHVIGQMRRPVGGELSEDWAESRHGPDGHAELEQRRVHLQDAVRRLPLSLRQAVTLALEGFSHAEIADTLGITANSVGVRLSRAKAALKAVLGDGQ